VGRHTHRAVAGGLVATMVALGLGASTAGAATPAPTTASFGLALGVTKGSTTSVITGQGAINFSTGDLTATVTVPAGAAGSSSSAEKVQVVVDAGTLYVSIPGLASVLGGKQWLSFSLSATAAASVTKDTQSLASELANVRGIVSSARSSGATVTSLGTRTINGVRALGYQLTVHTSGASSLAPGLSGALGSQANAALKGLPATVPVRVWADSRNRLVRVSTVVTVKPKGSTSERLAVTFNVLAYNAPVTVTAPPASSTGQLPAGVLQQLLGGLKSGSLGASGLGSLFGGSTSAAA
jgi:hypothetical protein